MKTISVIGYRRPDYLGQTLAALKGCRGLEDYTVLVSVDGPPSISEPCCVVAEQSGFEWEHYFENYGVNTHNRLTLERMFEDGSDFNVHVEDDTVPALDFLNLCDWFYSLPNRDDYACLNLFSGWTNQLSRPLEMAEQFGFCPWGWAVTREMWERWFLPEWNGKKLDPKGWDWSMSLTIQRHGLKVLRPVLSRVRNIGREGGTYATPEYWDSVFPNLPLSDGSYGTDFKITMPLPAGYRESKMDDWARREIESERNES